MDDSDKKDVIDKVNEVSKNDGEKENNEDEQLTKENKITIGNKLSKILKETSNIEEDVYKVILNKKRKINIKNINPFKPKELN